MSVRLSPVLAGLGHLPVRAPRAGPGAACVPPAWRSSTSAWASRARRPGVHPRGARGRDHAAWRPTRPRSGCPELRGAIAGWAGRRFGATLDPDSEVIPTLGLQGGGVRARQTSSPATIVARADAVVPGLRARARSSRASGSLELPLTEANGWLPDLDAVRLDWRRRRPLAELPEQPDGRARAAGVLRARRRAGARSTGSSSPPTRRTRSSTSPASRRRARCSSPTARTWRSSTPCRSARRCPATAPGSSPATRRSSRR